MIIVRILAIIPACTLHLLAHSIVTILIPAAALPHPHQLTIETGNVNILFLNPRHSLMIFGPIIPNCIQKLLLLPNRLLIFLLHLDDLPLSRHQLLMFLQLFLLQLVILLHDELHLAF